PRPARSFALPPHGNGGFDVADGGAARVGEVHPRAHHRDPGAAGDVHDVGGRGDLVTGDERAGEVEGLVRVDHPGEVDLGAEVVDVFRYGALGDDDGERRGRDDVVIPLLGRGCRIHVQRGGRPDRIRELGDLCPGNAIGRGSGELPPYVVGVNHVVA